MTFHHDHTPGACRDMNSKYHHRIYAHGEAQGWLGTDLLAYNGEDLDSLYDGDFGNDCTLVNLDGESRPATVYLWTPSIETEWRPRHHEEDGKVVGGFSTSGHKPWRVGLVVFYGDEPSRVYAEKCATKKPEFL